VWKLQANEMKREIKSITELRGQLALDCSRIQASIVKSIASKVVGSFEDADSSLNVSQIHQHKTHDDSIVMSIAISDELHSEVEDKTLDSLMQARDNAISNLSSESSIKNMMI